MRLPIQSWCVAVAGALLAILSTVVLTLVVEHANGEAQSLTRTITDLEAQFDAQFQRYIRSEQLETTSATLAAFISLSDEGIIRHFILPRVGKYAVNAIEVLQGSEGYVTFPKEPAQKIEVTELMAQANRLSARLARGDLTAYDELANLAKDEQGVVAHQINDIRRQIRSFEDSLESWRSQAARWRYIQVSLNILGLIIVLLKDVPIWRRSSETGNGGS
ncbi:MAG: hypothetical protein OXI80_00945 [Caldilineaceae bacterium]|nr:hypothetical protein [Caldilineaceae bacterium]